MPKKNFSKSGVWSKVSEESALIFEEPEFPFNTVWDRWKEAPVPKTSSIHSAFSIELRLVTDTDRQTDTGPQLVPALAWRRAAKKQRTSRIG